MGLASLCIHSNFIKIFNNTDALLKCYTFNICKKLYSKFKIEISGLQQYNYLNGCWFTASSQDTRHSATPLTSASVDGGRTERFPYNRFTDIGGNEERDTRAKAITFL